MQAAGTDVLGLLVDLVGNFGQALDTVGEELDVQPFGLEQRLVLLGQRSVRFLQDALEVFRGQSLEFDTDRQTALQLRHQVARFAQVERTRSDEQDMVGLDHAQFGVDGAAFDQRQQVALNALAGHIGAADVAALGHFVDFVDEHDTVLFNRFQGLGLELFFVDQAARFFLADHLQRFLDLELARLALALAHVGEQVLQLVGHLFHARRRGNLDAHGIRHFDLDFLVVQLAFAQALAEQLAGVGIAAGLRGFFAEAGDPRLRQQGVEDAVFGGVFGAVAHADDLLLAEHLQRGIGQVADDRFDVTAYIADFGELGRFDLDERRVGQLGQAAGDFGLADTGRADHQDVLRRHLGTQLGRQLHAPPAVAQGDGHGALGVVLADDVAVEFVDDLAGGHGHDENGPRAE
ncbi:hypothetical protein D3C76_719020 [compost metagenome]